MRKVLIDAHTHTVASGHAYSSLQEMVKAASDIDVAIKTYYSDYQSVCFTKKG